MPYIPHKENEIKEMLETIGINSLEDLFEEIPPSLRIFDLPGIPEGLSEFEIGRLMFDRAQRDMAGTCFIGAGAYDHYRPIAIADIILRGEFLTSYTPYQAEASQGILQVFYEFQTMIASLMGLDVANASMYDGATALAEAILMAARIHPHDDNWNQILMPLTVNPAYRRVVQTIISQQGLKLIDIPYNSLTGETDLELLDKNYRKKGSILVIPQPNFFGILEDVDALADFAKQQQMLSIALVNPLAMSLFKEPGKWGQSGVDIACGEGQPFGIPLSSGGPFLGLLACKKEYIKQMPGHIAGVTTDGEGNRGFTLTLQTREQHVRRSRATSNICSNQGLMAIAAALYMSLLGPEGLRRVAGVSHNHAVNFAIRLSKIKGVEKLLIRPFFHEFVLRLNKPVATVLDKLAGAGIQGGFNLTKDYPELGECLLVCVTETKSEEDFRDYETLLRAIMETPRA